MGKKAPLEPFVFSAVLISLSFTVACGGGSFNDPPGIAATSVANTQNPLVAQYTITAALGCPGQVQVEFGPDTTYGRSTAWYPTTATSQTTNILVAGMKASTTYHMRAKAQCASGVSTFTSDDVTFTTGPLPTLTLPGLAVTRPSPSASSPENPGIEMVTVTAPNYPAFFTDRDANPIWYYDVGAGNYPFTFKLLPNGHIILSITEPTFSLIREVDLAGNMIRDMDIFTLQQKMQNAGYDFVPAGFHHDLLPLANGHLVVLVDCTKSFSNLPGYPGTTVVQGDALIDLDQNWNPVWAWNSFDYIGNGLDINRHLNGLSDWTHSNALVYSPDDGNLLLSMRHQSWILKINYANGTGAGNIIWHLGYQGDFALTENGVPTDDPSLWFSFQHFPSLISQNGPQTTLAIWDNGDNRVLDTNGDLCSYPGTPSPYPGCYSRATKFLLDESAMVANLEWADQQQYYGFWGGSINEQPNGNIEFDLNDPIVQPGPNVVAYVQEVTQTATPQVVWQMQVAAPADAYRAYRVPSLYNGVSWPY
jgi:arylsulfate sulfotransferase